MRHAIGWIVGHAVLVPCAIAIILWRKATDRYHFKGFRTHL